MKYKIEKGDKILIIGHARHGKDELALLLQSKYNLKFSSSSEFCNELFIYDALKNKYNYSSKEECFEDRKNHRVEWMDLIKDFNKDDKSKLCKEILKENDIYVGLRSYAEFEESRKLFDLVIYVDAMKRTGLRDETMEIPVGESDIIITNNGTLEEFKKKINKIFV